MDLLIKDIFRGLLLLTTPQPGGSACGTDREAFRGCFIGEANISDRGHVSSCFTPDCQRGHVFVRDKVTRDS